MASLAEIKERFEQANFFTQWNEVLAESPFSEEKKEKLWQWITEKWERFVSLAEPIDIEEEFDKFLRNQYIEIKSNWVKLNTFIQYELFRSGQPDEDASYRASLLSHLVEFFGNNLSKDEKDLVNKLLVQSISQELQEREGLQSSNENLEAQVQSMEMQLNDLYEQNDRLYRELGTSDVEQLINMVHSLESQLNDLYEQKREQPGSDSGEAQATIDNLEMQLQSLYQEREKMSRRFGITNVDSMMQMIESMDEQLQTLYQDLENAVVIEGKQVTIMGPRKVIVRKDAGSQKSS
jgi:DNA repair exonuclease SbcCD ATPase subunit